MKNYESEIDYFFLFWVGLAVGAIGLVFLGVEVLYRPAEGISAYFTRGYQVISAVGVILVGAFLSVVAHNRDRLLELRRSHSVQTEALKCTQELMRELVSQEHVDGIVGNVARQDAEAESLVLNFPNSWKATPDESPEEQSDRFHREYQSAKYTYERTKEWFGRLSYLVGTVGQQTGTYWHVYDRDWYVSDEHEKAS